MRALSILSNSASNGRGLVPSQAAMDRYTLVVVTHSHNCFSPGVLSYSHATNLINESASQVIASSHFPIVSIAMSAILSFNPINSAAKTLSLLGYETKATYIMAGFLSRETRIDSTGPPTRLPAMDEIHRAYPRSATTIASYCYNTEPRNMC